MQKFLALVFLFFLYSCQRSQQSTDFSYKETDFAQPNTMSLKLPKTYDTKWGASTKVKPKARILKTKFEPFKGPFFDVNHSHPLKTPIDSLNIKLNQLPSIDFFVELNKTKKIKPKIILLGTPKKVKVQIPIVENMFVYGLTELGQDQGLPGTSVSNIVQDNNGLLWFATDNGLCFYDGEYLYIYLKNQGLSQQYKISLCVDKNGHIWAAGNGVDEIIPEKGIIKHYGKQEGLNSNNINSVLIDNVNRVWLTGSEGVDVFNPVNGENAHLSTKQGLSVNFINKMTQDVEGRFWFASNGGGVDIYDPFAKKLYNLKQINGLSNDDIRAIICDKKGNIWLGGWNGGLDMYSITTGKYYQLRKKHGLAFGYIHNLIEDHHGKIWISYQEHGVDIYTPSIKKIQHIYGEPGFVKSTVLCCYEDKQNNIWMGTSSAGLIKYVPNNGLISNYTNKFWQGRSSIISIYEDSQNDIWLGNAGQGIDIFNPSKGTLNHLNTGGDWTDAWQNYFLDDGIGHVYMGTEYRFNIWDRSKQELKSWSVDDGLINDRISCAQIINKGILFGTRSGLDKYDTLTSTFEHLQVLNNPLKNAVICMAKDSEGCIWIGTFSAGVYKYNPFTTKLMHFSKENGLVNAPVYCILIDKKECIWLGTGSEGLKKIDLKKNTITTFGVDNGLAEMNVLSLLEKDEKIYVGTARGLSIIKQNQQNYSINNMSKAQGFRTMDFNFNAAIISKDSSLWWGIGDVLTNYIPSNTLQINNNVALTGIEIMGKEPQFGIKQDFLMNITNHDTIWSALKDTFYFKDKFILDTSYLTKNNISWNSTYGTYHIPIGLNLPYNQNHITFHFTGNYLSNSDKTKYKYILEGIEQHWNIEVNVPFADYRNIPPGNYKFKVCSTNNGGLWSKPTEISFTITPPWWKSPAAYIVYIIGLISIIIGYNRYRTANLLKKQKQLEIIVSNRTQEVVNQKNEIQSQKQSIEEKQKEILDSIRYAKRIQTAILANEKYIEKNINRLKK